jgi:hypothetical protein
MLSSFSLNSMYKFVELDHVNPSLVHELFKFRVLEKKSCNSLEML